MKYMDFGPNGGNPPVLDHVEWLRVRKASPPPLAGLALYRRKFILGSYIQPEAAALARCSTFDLGVVDAASDEELSIAAGWITMDELRRRYRLRGDRALASIGAARAYAWLDNLTALRGSKKGRRLAWGGALFRLKHDPARKYVGHFPTNTGGPINADELVMLTGIPSGMQFGAILADPGIAFVTRSAKGESRTPQARYRCMPFDDLAAMPVACVAADDCFLFLWVPNRSVYLVKPLMEAWGFEFSGTAFQWIKLNKSGRGLFMSTGYGTRKGSETCWLGRRGTPKRKSKRVREVMIAPIREHSRKPDETYHRIEQLTDGPYLEVFARQQWRGWTCIGDEVQKFSAVQTNEEDD